MGGEAVSHKRSLPLTTAYMALSLYVYACMQVGNGGLSFRKTEAMARCMDLGIEHQSGYAEDMFIIGHCKDILNIPSWEDARSFAVESEFYEPTLGLHKPWQWLEKWEEAARLMRSYNKSRLGE